MNNQEDPPAAPVEVVAVDPSKVDAAQAVASGRLGGFDALKVRAYQWYALCASLQQAAESMQMLANGWFAFELTHSTSVLGLTVLAQALPQTFLSFIGGVFSDRFPRHRVWQVCNFAALMLPLWIAISISLHAISWHDLVIRSFLFGIVLAFRAPARQGVMTEVVGRDKIMSAVSINQAIMNILQFAGPSAAGFVIGSFGIETEYLVIAAFYIMAIMSLMPMKYERRNIHINQGPRVSFLQNIKDGLKYVARTPDVRAVLGLTLVAGMFAMPYTQLLPAFGKTVLHTTPSKLGFLVGLEGVGALCGSLGVTMVRPKSRGLLFIRATLWTGIALIAFTISSSFIISGVIVLLVGLGQSLRQSMASTLIQTYTEDGYLGRVLSVNFTQNSMSSLIGFGVAIGAGFIGVRYAVMTTSVLLACAGASWYVFSQRLRHLS